MYREPGIGVGMILRRSGAVWRLVRANWTVGVSVYVVALAIGITATVYAQPADNGANDPPDSSVVVSGASEDDCDPKIPFDCTPTATPTPTRPPIPTPTAGECDLKEENCEPATSTPVPPTPTPTYTPTPDHDATATAAAEATADAEATDEAIAAAATAVARANAAATAVARANAAATAVARANAAATAAARAATATAVARANAAATAAARAATATAVARANAAATAVARANATATAEARVRPPTATSPRPTTPTLAFTPTLPDRMDKDSFLHVTARARNLQPNVDYSLSISARAGLGIDNCDTESTGGTRVLPPEGTKTASVRACITGTGVISASLTYYDTKYKEERLLLRITHDIQVVLPADPCTNLSFQSARVQDQTWTTATVVNVTLPEATGDSCDPSYTLEGPTSNPGLPSGIMLDSSTRQLSGTPTARMARTQYTWTATDRRDSSATTSLTFHITVTEEPTPTPPPPPPPPGLPKLKAPTGLDVTPLPQRKARLNWAAVPNANGYTVQIRFAGSDWVDFKSTNARTIEMELDNVVNSLGLANEDYFEFQVKASDSSNSYRDSNFSETVRIIDTPIVRINGKSSSTAQANVKWSAPSDVSVIGYEIRWHKLLGVHDSLNPKQQAFLTHREIGWYPQPAAAWSGPDNAGPSVREHTIDSLQMYEVYGVQLIYRYEDRDEEAEEVLSSGKAFSAREAYVWPSNRVSKRSEPGDIIGGMPVAHNPVTAKTDSGTISYFYRICEETLPSGKQSDWVNFINHALLQWEYASDGLVKMVHLVDPNGNSLRCSNYKDFLDEIATVVASLEGYDTPTDDIVTVVGGLLENFQNNGLKSTRTGGLITPSDEQVFDLLQNEIMMLPDITTLMPRDSDFFKRRAAIFSEVNRHISVGNCPSACAMTNETTDALGNKVRTSDIYLSEEAHGKKELIDLSGGKEIKFNTCPDYPNGNESDPYNYPYSSLVHEAGHALGIGQQQGITHPTMRDSIMNYFLREPDCSPHPFDILAIYTLYQSEG